MKIALALLGASQVLAGGHDEYDEQDFKFKGAFRGKASVWKKDSSRWPGHGHRWSEYKQPWEDKHEDKWVDKGHDDKWADKGHDDKWVDKGHEDWGHWSHRYCQKVCEQTPGCRRDPQAHGSYCKFQGNDGRPAVCFGLYRIPKALCYPHEYGRLSRKYCFEPFSRHCNDARLKPVRCDREPKFDSWGAVVNLELFLEGDDLH